MGGFMDMDKIYHPYSQIRRYGNKVAHNLVWLALASVSCTMWMDDVPSQTLPFV